MNIRIVLLTALGLAAACDRTTPTAPESPDPVTAKSGGKPRWIAFGTDRTGPFQIWRVKADGGGLQQLTELGENRYPGWSPDARHIVFTSYRDGPAEIYIMNADGNNQRRITNNPTVELQPDWAPNGNRIAFASDALGTMDIHGMNPDGTNWGKIVGFHSSQEIYPSWSPTGRYLAFLSDAGHSQQYTIWVHDFLTGGTWEVEGVPLPIQRVSWSADGTRVVFYYDVDDGYVYTMDVVTFESTILLGGTTLGTHLGTGVDVSGTGDRLAYLGQGVGGAFLASANLDGSDRKILEQSSSYHESPVWSK